MRDVITAAARASSSFESAALVPKSLRAFVRERSVIDFLIDDLLRRGWLYSVTGNTGHGKTAIAVPVSLSVADALQICGHQCQQGQVLYIAGENADDVRVRFVAALERMTVSTSALDRVHVIDQSFLLNERLVELCALIERLDVALVIVDTDQAVSLSGADDENSNGDRMAHAKQLRQLTRCSSFPTVIDLCHPRKGAQKDDFVPRGGSAFINEVDGNLRLWRDGEVAELFSDPNKFRGAPVSISFRSESVQTAAIKDTKDRMIPVPFFRPIDDHEAARTADAQWRDENRLLFFMNENPNGTQAQWAERCGWLSDDNKPRKDKVNRLLQALSRSPQIMVQKGRSGRWRLTSAGLKEATKP